MARSKLITSLSLKLSLGPGIGGTLGDLHTYEVATCIVRSPCPTTTHIRRDGVNQMLKATSSTGDFPKLSEFSQGVNGKLPISSSLQMGWNSILVEEYQYSRTPSNKAIPPLEVPALCDHWLVLPLGSPIHLSQQSGDSLYESTLQKGDSLLVPAGQPSCWRCRRRQPPETVLNLPVLHIHLQPKLVEQVAEAAEMTMRQDLVSHCAQQDLNLQHIAMLLLAELRSDGMMGKLYVESLTQALAIHLLRHYSASASTIPIENRCLTHVQLQQAIDYIHTYLNQDLSLAELASVINISPNYFARLFKRAMGISPHQYVIQQRVERAKVMLLTTDLPISDIALQVGFSSQSHLTQHFKRVIGMTPKQVR